MNLMDPRTTILIGSITCGLMALVLALLARATPLPVPGLRTWVSGAWLVFAALLLLGLRDMISNLASVTLGNSALMLAYIVWLSGTHQHFGRRIHLTFWLAACAIAIIATTWFVYVQESFRVRVVVVAGLCTFINARHAYVLLRHPRPENDRRAIGIPLAAAWLIALTCVYGLRCLHALALPQGISGLLTQDTIQVLYTSSFTICNLMLVISFATMASDHVRARIEDLATRDPLTGTLNRRALFESLERELARGRRGGRAFCVAMLDIDHFKTINDRFGHPVGDQVLAHMCQRTIRLVRPHDVFARYGGEEFVIVMPETALPAATQAAQRILNVLATTGDPSLPAITVSIGLAQWSEDDVSAASLVARADAALYAAKANGRNRVEIS